MSVDNDKIVRFTALRKKREELQREYTRREATIESSRTRYANIMKELASLSIGSLDELRQRIVSLDALIESELKEAENQMVLVQEKLSALNNKEASPTSAG